MVSEFPVGFQPSSSIPACGSFVDLGRLLAHGERPSPHWRHRIHVGRALRPLAQAPFVFPHRLADCASLGLACPWLRSPGPAVANSNHRSRAHLLAFSATSAQHELCVSGSLAAPRMGARAIALTRDPRGVHRVFLLANAPCVLANFPSGSKACMKLRQSLEREDSIRERGRN